MVIGYLMKQQSMPIDFVELRSIDKFEMAGI